MMHPTTLRNNLEDRYLRGKVITPAPFMRIIYPFKRNSAD